MEIKTSRNSQSYQVGFLKLGCVTLSPPSDWNILKFYCRPQWRDVAFNHHPPHFHNPLCVDGHYLNSIFNAWLMKTNSEIVDMCLCVCVSVHAHHVMLCVTLRFPKSNKYLERNVSRYLKNWYSSSRNNYDNIQLVLLPEDGAMEHLDIVLQPCCACWIPLKSLVRICWWYLWLMKLWKLDTFYLRGKPIRQNWLFTSSP